MDITLLIAPDGQLVLTVENQNGLTFAQARARLIDLKARLAAEGTPVIFADEVEQHIHGPAGRHISGDISEFMRGGHSHH